MKRRAVFVYFPNCEVLDFAGPQQALHEANLLTGGTYEFVHCAVRENTVTYQGLQLGALRALPRPRATDLVFVPGYPIQRGAPPREVMHWLRECYSAGARIFAVCTGAFVLARAGLLDGRSCTTHWKRTDELQAQFRKCSVVTGRLFVNDGQITTSAGVSSGIDMALDLLAQEHGAAFAARVARELVVYIRRDGSQKQESIYLDYRTHIDPAIHAVQDWITTHPGDKCPLTELATVAHMSTRNLTRAFLKATGISVSAYRQQIRLEHAKSLLANPELTIENVAAKSGFSDARQLRRLWKATYGSSPRAARV